jgi:hypothetical protein
MSEKSGMEPKTTTPKKEFDQAVKNRIKQGRRKVGGQRPRRFAAPPTLAKCFASM